MHVVCQLKNIFHLPFNYVTCKHGKTNDWYWFIYCQSKCCWYVLHSMSCFKLCYTQCCSDIICPMHQLCHTDWKLKLSEAVSEWVGLWTKWVECCTSHNLPLIFTKLEVCSPIVLLLKSKIIRSAKLEVEVVFINAPIHSRFNVKYRGNGEG